LMNLLEPDGRFWGLCTPWHRDDLNAELKGNDAYAVFRRAVSSELDAVWPERWPREALARRREEVGEVSFARAYRLVPVDDDHVPIRVGSVQFWDMPFEPDLVVLAVDPALSVDPRADRSALVVVDRRLSEMHCPEMRCLDAIARRVSAPDLIDLI